MANENEQGFAISCPDGLWVAGIIEAGGKRRWVLGVEKKRRIYSTWAAACSESDRMCRPDEDGYKILELGAADGYEERAEESV